MNKEKLHLLAEANDTQRRLLQEAERIALLRQQYHNGATVRLTLEVNGETVEFCDLLANGKQTTVEALFGHYEEQIEWKLNETVCDMQTVCEQGGEA